MAEVKSNTGLPFSEARLRILEALDYLYGEKIDNFPSIADKNDPNYRWVRMSVKDIETVRNWSKKADDNRQGEENNA